MQSCQFFGLTFLFVWAGMFWFNLSLKSHMGLSKSFLCFLVEGFSVLFDLYSSSVCLLLIFVLWLGVVYFGALVSFHFINKVLFPFQN